MHMSTRRRVLGTLAALPALSLLAASPWAAGIAHASERPRPSVSKSGDKILVTDLVGRRVEVKAHPQRFVVANYIANFMLVGGSGSLKKVVALPQDGWKETRMGEYVVFTEAFPELTKLPSIGGYHDDVLNTERILSLKPDVLLVGITQYNENAKRIALLERAGIPTVVLDYHAMTLENHTGSTRILGALLDEEERSDAQCRNYEERLKTVSERIAALPASRRGKRVYVECGNRGLAAYGNTYNRTILWGAILKNIGASNLAENMREPYGALDREFVLAKNPEVIVIAGSIWVNGTEGDQMRMGLTVDRADAKRRLAAFAKRPLWEKLDAVQKNEVYAVDHGSLRSMLDCAFTEYLAKILYPDVFTDIDPEAEIADFYKTYLPEIRANGVFCFGLKD